MAFKKHSVLPGFGLSFGYTVFYLCLLVLLPLAMLVLKAFQLSWADFWQTVSSERAVAAYRLSIGSALVAAGINAFFGLLVAWVLVRYRFPGRRLLDGLVDLPFALPTAVAGITLATLYSTNGWIGGFFAEAGIKIAFTQAGIVAALAFIGLPFVVRSVQPVLEDLDTEAEEAAACLGARRWQTLVRVIAPEIWPALLTGFALSLARGLGEYGSVIFIAGNLPFSTEITPLLIMIKLEQYDIAGATALALVFLLISFMMIFLINLLERYSNRSRKIR